MANTGSTKTRRTNTTTPAPVPYLKMLTSGPFWALQAAVCGYAWVAYIMLTLTPSYLHNIQNVSYSIVRISRDPYEVMIAERRHTPNNADMTGPIKINPSLPAEQKSSEQHLKGE